MNYYDDINRAAIAYTDFLVASYEQFIKRSYSDEERARERVNNFRNSIEVRFGRKYIKIIVENSVRAFIVNTDNDKKFEYGDLLFAASFAAPARNVARGNVIRAEYSGDWCGPAYLK